MGTVGRLVAYDVPNNGGARPVNALKNLGVQVQFSVFECRLDAAQAELPNAGRVKLLKTEEDRQRVYSPCAARVHEVET